jgi:hypothetical protein
MKRLFNPSTHSNIFLAGLIFLTIGMIYSGPVASMAIMLLGANWFAEGNYGQKMKLFYSNKTALLLSSVFFMHAIGLLWSTDFAYGWDDVRTKIPLFVIPFILSTTPPLAPRPFRILLYLFVAGILFSSFISASILAGIFNSPVHDIRDISIFISHIRLSLMVCLSIFVLIYFIPRTKHMILRILYGLAVAWLLIFLALLESLTGLIIFSIVSCLLGFYYFKSRSPWIGKIILITACGVIILSAIHVYEIAKSFTHIQAVDVKNLPHTTSRGNSYDNTFDFPIAENGTYVTLQIAWPELKKGWETHSKLPFESKDLNGNPITMTLVRYMASLGMLKKDSVSFSKLSPEDIQCVENGVTNYKYKNVGSLNARIYETIWEIDVYFKGSNPSGHSVIMRFEFWKTGWHILKKHVFAGVGTGDVKKAFEKQYTLENSKLDARWHLRAHDQYLAIAIALGLPGLALFLFSLIYPLLANRMYRNYFYIVFWVIVTLSMLTEDTLETQAGATFYVLFNSVFLFAQPLAKTKKPALDQNSEASPS